MCPPDCSHDSDFVGNIKGVLVAGEGDVSLLLTSWGDEGVNLLDLDAVPRQMPHTLVVGATALLRRVRDGRRRA